MRLSHKTICAFVLLYGVSFITELHLHSVAHVIVHYEFRHSLAPLSINVNKR